MNVNMGRIQPLARRDLTKTKLTHKDPLAFAEFETQTAMLMRSTGGLAFTAANRSKDTTSVFKRHLDHLTDRQVESAEAQMAAYAAAQGAAVPNPLPQVINIPGHSQTWYSSCSTLPWKSWQRQGWPRSSAEMG